MLSLSAQIMTDDIKNPLIEHVKSGHHYSLQLWSNLLVCITLVNYIPYVKMLYNPQLEDK